MLYPLTRRGGSVLPKAVIDKMARHSAAMSFLRHGAAWQPVLSGETAARALETVRTTAAELSELNLDEPSLAGGSAGLALLYSYCGQAEPGDDDDQIAVQHLSQAIEAVGTMNLSPSLYGGFTGVAWAMQHLRDRLFDTDDEDQNCAIDVHLPKEPGRKTCGKNTLTQPSFQLRSIYFM
jgi:Lanthionine synthetase C-like protein